MRLERFRSTWTGEERREEGRGEEEPPYLPPEQKATPISREGGSWSAFLSFVFGLLDGALAHARLGTVTRRADRGSGGDKVGRTLHICEPHRRHDFYVPFSEKGEIVKAFCAGCSFSWLGVGRVVCTSKRRADAQRSACISPWTYKLKLFRAPPEKGSRSHPTADTR